MAQEIVSKYGTISNLSENIVDFAVNPNPNTAGTVFTPVQPADADVLYVSAIDYSTWKWNGASYVTYTPPAKTEFNLLGTSTDAGSNKTAEIERNGAVLLRKSLTVRNRNNASSIYTYTHNIVSAEFNGNFTGGFVIDTGVGRASTNMSIFHVTGYAYGTSKIIDFKIVVYPYSGALGPDGYSWGNL